MKILRFVLVLAVIGYAGWLAWPFLSPFFEGAPTTVATERASAMVEAGGGIPQAALWIGAVALYLVAAFMLGAGNPKAAVAYFLGFIADAVLRLALDQQGGSDVAARSGGPAGMAAPDAVSSLPVEPVWLVLGAVFLLGVLVVVASRRMRRKREAGQLNF